MGRYHPVGFVAGHPHADDYYRGRRRNASQPAHQSVPEIFGRVLQPLTNHRRNCQSRQLQAAIPLFVEKKQSPEQGHDQCHAGSHLVVGRAGIIRHDLHRRHCHLFRHEPAGHHARPPLRKRLQLSDRPVSTDPRALLFLLFAQICQRLPRPQPGAGLGKTAYARTERASRRDADRHGRTARPF